MMKKILAIVIALVFMVSCATVQNKQGKPSASEMASQIEDSVSARTIKVEFDYVTPLRMPPHYLTTTYSVQLKGDTIISDLPYFGRAYRSNIANNDRSPLSFSGIIETFQTVKGRKNDYTLTLRTRSDNELLEYILNVYPNGQAYLTVNSSDRETINFNGEVVL